MPGIDPDLPVNIIEGASLRNHETRVPDLKFLLHCARPKAAMLSAPVRNVGRRLQGMVAGVQTAEESDSFRVTISREQTEGLTRH